MMHPKVLRKLKNSLIYWTTRLALATLGWLPERLRPAGGRAIGRLAHALARRERERARRQLADALGLPPRSARVALLTRGVFAHLGRSAVEICGLLRSGNRQPPVDIPPAALRALDEALAAGAGVVFVTGHIGNWELMARELARRGYPISTVAKESYDPRFTRLIDDFRARGGVQAIYRGRPGASTALLRTLRRGRVLGMLIDQDTDVPGDFVAFFGRPAYTPVGAAVIAARAGAPLVVGTIHRTPGGRHRVLIEPVPAGADPTATTARLTACLERRIRRHPSQWVWFHERWKTRPDQVTAPAAERAA